MSRRSVRSEGCSRRTARSSNSSVRQPLTRMFPAPAPACFVDASVRPQRHTLRLASDGTASGLVSAPAGVCETPVVTR